MDLWQLHVFCKVVECRSFSKAGAMVHLSQPTVSSHIKDLEDHFGCRLIDRLSKEAVATGAGELLYKQSLRLLRLRDQTESEMAEYLGKMTGRLTIGGSTIPGGYLLPRLIGEFKTNFQEIRISLIVGDTEAVVQDILSGAIEIGVVGAQIRNRAVESSLWMEDEMQVVVPSDHRWAGRRQITTEMLTREPFIIRESGSGTLKSIQLRLSQVNCHLEDFNVASEMGSTAAVIQGIKSHVGISILSPISIAEELASGRLKAIRLRGVDLKRGFYLIRHRHRTMSPLAKAFLTFLREAGPVSSP
jgi:DNA-binding transcriptional LysR family regulator